MSKEQVEPGDMAIIRGWGQPANDGKLVAVKNQVFARETVMRSVDGVAHTFINESGCKVFMVESLGGPLHLGGGHPSFTEVGVAASCLRPIRNPPGPDETLRWADVPRNDYVDAGFMPLGD